MQRPRLLIYDRQLVAEGLTQMLHQEFDLLGAVHESTKAFADTIQLLPDILIVEPCLNDALGTVLKIRAHAPSVKIIFVTAQGDRSMLGVAIRSGVAGFVVKTQSSADLCAAVKTVAKGKTYVAPQLRDAVPWARALRPMKGETVEENLTPRQVEVLGLVALGQTTREIGETLGISQKTAEFHKAGLMTSLGIRTTAGLVRFAVEQNLISCRPARSPNLSPIPAVRRPRLIRPRPAARTTSTSPDPNPSPSTL